jgi:DNA-binding response OmpR family regulator
VAKILLIEDDLESCQMTNSWLALDHHDVEYVTNGEDARARLRVYHYDVILLDWQLPNHSGLDILKEFRGRGGTSPVLILTGRTLSSDKEIGLDAGADDYLTKPYDGKELLARIRALLRRPPSYAGAVIAWGNILLDSRTHRVTREGQQVHLLPTEFALLEFLLRNPNRIFSPEALLDRIWENEATVSVDAVTSCIKRLRKKIDTKGQPSLIRSIYGVGYKLEQPESDPV